MSQKLICISVIIVFIVFNPSICLTAQHVYFSEPDVTNPYIPAPLRESCGYRYGLYHRTIKYSKQCFKNSFPNKYLTKPINETLIRQTLTRILGGQDIKYREAPWVVQFVRKEGSLFGSSFHHHCTGVLITMKYILTAAHCITHIERVSIFAGEDQTTQGWRATPSEFTFTQHPKFFKGDFEGIGKVYNKDYDIAIVTLHTPIDWERYGKDWKGFYRINPICLPLPENFTDPKFKNRYYVYQKATIYGWGQHKGKDSPGIIQRGDVMVKYTTEDSRDEDVDKFISDASGNKTRACKGDSGAGLVQYLDEYESRAVLIGIESNVHNKFSLDTYPCDLEHVGDFMSLRVVYYLDWINEYLKKEPIIP